MHLRPSGRGFDVLAIGCAGSMSVVEGVTLEGEDASGSVLDRRRWATPALLSLIVVLGAVVRIPGLTRGDLFYDDSLFALPARASFSTALKMTGSAPGAMLLQRSWTMLRPSATWFAQLLPLGAAVAGLVVLYALARSLGRPRWAALVMAGMGAASPAAIEYAVHLGEYELAMLAAALLLLVTELVRRRTTPLGLMGLAVMSVMASVLAVELVAVVLACWSALVVLCLLERRQRAMTAAAGLVTVVLSGVVAVIVIGRLPTAVHATWVRAHLLVVAPLTSRHLSIVVGTAAAGLGHGLLGTPMARPQSLTRDLLTGTALDLALLLALAEALLLVVLLIPVARSLVNEARARDRSLLASALVVIVAIVLFLAGAAPLGSGRGDLVWYPAILALVVVGVERLARLVAPLLPSLRARSVGAVMAAVVVGIFAARFAWHERAWYPNQDVSKLVKVIGPRLHPGDAIVVDRRNVATWAFAGLSPFAIHTDRAVTTSAPAGYSVSLDPPRVLAEVWVRRNPSTGTAPFAAAVRSVPGLRALPVSTTRVFEIGVTGWAVDPWAARRWGPTGRLLLPTAADVALKAAGWRPTRWVNETTGVFSRVWLRR